jgi:hypothetical protein
MGLKFKVVMCALLCVQLAAFGCASVEKPQAVLTSGAAILPDIKFSGITNADMIVNSILNIALPDKIPPKAIILVAPLEKEGDSEKRNYLGDQNDEITTLVEDTVISKLIRMNLAVVERDMDILSRIFHEQYESYLISIAPDLDPRQFYSKLLEYLISGTSSQAHTKEPGVESLVKKDDKGKAQSQAWDPLKQTIGDTFLPNYVFQNYPYVLHPFSGEKALQRDIRIQSADYVLSFRVLECGIRYNPVAQKLYDKYDQVERIAITKLHLRLTNAKTGVTVWADNRAGVFSEVTPSVFVKSAEKGLLEFSGFANPTRKKGDDSKKKNIFGQ